MLRKKHWISGSNNSSAFSGFCQLYIYIQMEVGDKGASIDTQVKNKNDLKNVVRKLEAENKLTVNGIASSLGNETYYDYAKKLFDKRRLDTKE